MKTINFTPSQLDTFSQTVLLIENFDIYENDYISGVQDYLQELEDNNELNEEQKSLLQLLTNHVTQN